MARGMTPSDDGDRAMDETPDNQVEDVPGSDAGEEEYEIEAILDAKKGMFEAGRIGYFVKWKGYPHSENSWVDEKDAENAKELTDVYWKAKGKERKSNNEPRGKPAKERRKSAAAAAAASDDESPAPSRAKPAKERRVSKVVSGDETSAPKKRGRQSKGGASSKADMEEEPTRAPKKSRKSNGKEPSMAPSMDLDQEEEEQDPAIGNMGPYMHLADWEPIITSVDTVVQDGRNLEVFFTLNSGEHVKENAALCRQRFPQRLLDFYESHLKWRATEVPAE
ncbi:hypothetical protein ONZ45_g2892 [Pleurotus djamor]|nr:hypothetical protein ONZ45_g2892 [Pleurotus djamor]